ncbi:MAG: hypothetical protein HKO91_07710 [Desulfobacterales bacterium]|nr:hypothetical protein [Desulfobacterales bacterium]
MRKIIGNEVCVFLKSPADDEVVGLLVDVSEDELYLRDLDVSKLYIIPRGNVKYCTTDTLPSSERTLPTPEIRPTSNAATEDNMRFLDVFIDNNPVASIPVHPAFKLNEWHDGIVQVVLGCPDVQAAISGKVQKSIEYSPGKVYITTDGSVAPEDGQKAFVMGGSVATSFLNPSQMVSRLNAAAQQRGKKNDEEA